MNKTAIFALILMRGKKLRGSNLSAKLNFETLGKLIAAMLHLPVKDKRSRPMIYCSIR